MPFRPALEHEDGQLGVVLYNAFLPLWNHNWFQNIDSPLPRISHGQDLKTLPKRQQVRYDFYHGLARAVRLVGGEVLVNAADDDDDKTENQNKSAQIKAVLLWLPPRCRLTTTSIGPLYRSGFLSAMLRYGATGMYRINVTFEGNVAKMFKTAGIDYDQAAFIQMIAANPDCKGERAASRLLEWQLARHTERFADVPVVLDTTTTEAIRAYERLGFQLKGSVQVNTGTSRDGFKITAPMTDEDKRLAAEEHVQRVMVWYPSGPADTGSH